MNPVAPSAASLITAWRPDWIFLALLLAIGLGYLRTRLRGQAQGVTWPVRRDVLFAGAWVLTLWVSCGFLNAWAGTLMWVWTTQQLLLLLVLPILLLGPQPLQLLRRVSPNSLVLRALRSPPLRVLGHPLLGPALVPIACLLLFFGGAGQAAVSHVLVGSLVAVALLLIGSLIALPLVDADDARSSLAVGLSLAVGFVELILDAFPGIVLRFQTHLTIPHFAVGRPIWAGGWLEDQHTAGSILWVVAELLDLPFLILAATRWIRADAREAAQIDAELDARDLRRVAQAPVQSNEGELIGRPWWLDDPEMRRRMGGPER